MMTRDEAEAAARKGAKVRHESFRTWEAWQTYNADGRLVDCFGNWRGPWLASNETGWSIVEPAPTPEPGAVLPLSECKPGWLVNSGAGPYLVRDIDITYMKQAMPNVETTLLSAAPGWTPVGEGQPGRSVEGCWADGVLVRSGSPSWIHSFIRLGESLPPDGERLVFWRDASHDAPAPVEPGLAWHDLVMSGIVKVGDRVRVSWVTQEGDTKNLFHVGDICEVGLGDTGSGPKYLSVQTRHGGFIAPRGDRVTFERVDPVEPDLAGQTLKLHPFGPQAGAPKDGARVLSLGEVAARVAELTRRFEALENPNEYDNSKLMPAPTFRTSRKPNPATEEAMADVAAGRVERFDTFEELMADLNAPDVMSDEEIVARVQASTVCNQTVDDAAREAIRLTRRSVLAQLAANEERAVKAFWDVTDRDAGLRAALAAIREGL